MVIHLVHFKGLPYCGVYTKGKIQSRNVLYLHQVTCKRCLKRVQEATEKAMSAMDGVGEE